MDPFSLTTISEYGLLMLRIVFNFQSTLSKVNEAELADRVRAAKYLRQISACLTEIDHELNRDNPRLSKHAHSMRIYLKSFEDRFTPLIGAVEARRLKLGLEELFDERANDEGPCLLVLLS